MCDFANFDKRRKIEIRNELLSGIPVLYLLYLQAHCTIKNKKLFEPENVYVYGLALNNMINLVVIYSKLAWEPSAAKVIKIYSHRLPAYEQFYRETNFSLIR